MADVHEAAAIADHAFGVAGAATALPGEHDENYHLRANDSEYLLKLGSPGADRAAIDLQNVALHAAAAAVPVPEPVPARVGGDVAEVLADDGTIRPARLLRWLEGDVWAASAPHEPGLLRDLGRHVAALDQALAAVSHPAAGRHLLWNLVHAAEHRRFLPLIADPAVRSNAEKILRRFEDVVAPALARLPATLIHNDANEDNILVGPDRRIAGLIDFGDLCVAPRICGLAVACAYALLSLPRSRDVFPLVAGYHELAPLEPEELALLDDLVRTRLAMSACMAAWQSSTSPDNRYLLVSQAAVAPLLARLAGESGRLAHYRARAACGYPASPTAAAIRRWLERVAPGPICDRPLGEAPFLDPAEWAGATFGLGRYGEDRDVYTTAAFATADPAERRTVHVGVDVFLPAGTPLLAPLAGVVEALEDRAAPLDFGPVVILAHETGDGTPFWTLWGHLGRDSLAPLAVGATVARGDVVGRIGGIDENGGWPPHLHLQLATDLLDRGTAMDGVVARSEVDVWTSICPDPTLILGLEGS